MENLREVYLDRTGIRYLPWSIENLKEIQYLDLAHCENLETLPQSICNLKSLKTLLVHNCSNLNRFPSTLKSCKVPKKKAKIYVCNCLSFYTRFSDRSQPDFLLGSPKYEFPQKPKFPQVRNEDSELPQEGNLEPQFLQLGNQQPKFPQVGNEDAELPLLAIMCSWVPLSILKYNKYNLLYERLFIINIIYYMNSYSLMEWVLKGFLFEIFIYKFFSDIFFENTEQEKRKNISILWFFL